MLLLSLKWKIPLSILEKLGVSLLKEFWNSKILLWYFFLKSVSYLFWIKQVEREDLPEELRPENRALGRLRSYFNGLSPYPEEGVERVDVAEPNQDDNISDPRHIEVDIPKEKVKDDHKEKKDYDDNSVNLKIDEQGNKKKEEVALETEPEEDGASRKGSDLPNQSADVLIKPLQAVQIRVGSFKKDKQEKENNEIEVIDS